MTQAPIIQGMSLRSCGVTLIFRLAGFSENTEMELQFLGTSRPRLDLNHHLVGLPMIRSYLRTAVAELPTFSIAAQISCFDAPSACDQYLSWCV